MKMDPPIVVVTRRPGRPSLPEPSADVHLTLPPGEYDEVYRLAARNSESVQDVIRRALKRLLRDESGAVLET